MRVGPAPPGAKRGRSLYQSLRNLTGKVLRSLRAMAPVLSPSPQDLARRVLSVEDRILKRFEPLLTRRITSLRMRTHGDYHLGQVLYTGKDFVVIDLDGGGDRSLPERRRKRSPLRDVAGMVRSLHSAAF